MSLLETVVITCPYCGEPNEIVIDTSQPQQSYIEDCFVCCRPVNVRVRVGDDQSAVVTVTSDDEA